MREPYFRVSSSLLPRFQRYILKTTCITNLLQLSHFIATPVFISTFLAVSFWKTLYTVLGDQSLMGFSRMSFSIASPIPIAAGVHSSNLCRSEHTPFFLLLQPSRALGVVSLGAFVIVIDRMKSFVPPIVSILARPRSRTFVITFTDSELC